VVHDDVGGSKPAKPPAKIAERKFFTVAEDHTIMVYLRENEAKLSSRAIAENIAKKVKHTVESVRDRIKRFLSRLRQIDEKYIAEVARYAWAQIRPIRTTTCTSPS
jgi:repressor of nif and glnA expression